MIPVEILSNGIQDKDVIKWKHFPRYWPFVWGIHRSLVNSSHKGQCRGALMFSLMCTRINGWVNNDEAGDLRCHHAHYDITVMHLNTANTMVAYVLVTQGARASVDMVLVKFAWNIPGSTPLAELMDSWGQFQYKDNQYRNSHCNALSKYRGHFSLNISRKTPHSHLWGRGIGCGSWIQSLATMLPV